MPKDFIWRGAEAKKIAYEAALQALKDGAEAILTASHSEVPHDTGTLQRSGMVSIGRLPDPGAAHSAASKDAAEANKTKKARKRVKQDKNMERLAASMGG